MGESLLTLSFFVGGVVIGALNGALCLPEWLTTVLLCLLMVQVGLGVGRSDSFRDIVRTLRPSILLLPLGTLAGTLLFSIPVAWIIARWSPADCVAVGCGMGYYSLSSVLITQLKAQTIGVQLAAELGAIALLANIFREMFVIVGAPLWRRLFGPLAPIAVGGATTADITLPSIVRTSGKEWVAVAVAHGILLDMSVPLLVPLFCV